MLYLGAYALLSTLPTLRVIGYVGPVLVAIVTLVIVPHLMQTTLPFGTVALVLLTLPFLICALLHLRSDRPAWLVVLTFGAVAMVVTQSIIISLPPLIRASETMLAAALAYALPLGLAWFALPALILFANPPQHAQPILYVVLITTGLAIWIIPMMRLGYIGQPMRYVDYASAFGPLNLLVSTAVFLFVALYSAILWRLIRPDF